MIFEQANFNVFRETWLGNENSISGVYRSKRYVNHTSLLAKCLSGCSDVASNESSINYDLEEVITLVNFPATFQVLTIAILPLFFSLIFAHIFLVLFLFLFYFSVTCPSTYFLFCYTFCTVRTKRSQFLQIKQIKSL